MKIMTPITWPCLLAVALLVSDAAAMFQAPWAKQRARVHGRKALGASIDKRTTRHHKEECEIKNATDIQAPKLNVWADLTEPEVASVLKWLFGQPDLNLTVTEEAGSWDNTV